MTSEEDSEPVIAARLVARIRAGGDDAAVAKSEFAARYSRGLETLLRYKTGDPDLAKDLRQDTLLRALEKLDEDGPNEPHRLSSWLNGIATNLLKNHNAKQARRQTDPAGEFAGIPVVDHEPLPAETLADREVSATVRMLLDELTVENDRDTLRRVYWLDQDAEEICRSLGIDRARLSRNLYKAKARFKKLILIAERRHGLHIVPADWEDQS